MTFDPDFDPPKPTWSPEVRAWVSLLLFAHLFAVFVAVTTYTRPSAMQEQLHTLFAPYLRNLHLATFPVTYPFARFHLTHAAPSDIDFTCEVDVKSKGGPTETIKLPQADIRPLVRLRRYQALANAVGTLTEGEANEEFSSILPRAIAGSILKQRGATEGTFRARAHFLPEIDDMDGVDAGRREPLENYRDLYEAQVFVTPSGVELLKKSTTLEVAPVEGAKKP